MLADLLKHRKPRRHIAHTLPVLYTLLKKGDHLLITDGVIEEA